MMLPELQNLAQIAVSRVLNSLPEGILIAGFAWLLLRFLPRENSGTRFAVWFMAMLTVAGIPFIPALGETHSLVTQNGAQSLLTLSDHWAVVLFSIWLLGVAVGITHLAIGICRLRSLRSGCRVIGPSDLPPALQKIAEEFSSSRSVMLATSDKLAVPSAIGFFQPMIVIPQWALHELSPEEFRIILLHEFAHLHRRDDWTNLFQKAVRAFFIFHPVIWWIERQLSLEREMACDDHVLAETGNPRGYAKCLVALLERNFARRAWAMVQAAVHRADEARRRLSRILDANRTNVRSFGKPALGLAGILSLLCLAIVPHAPQLVAFTPNAAEAHASAAPIFNNARFGSASVIPAALHVSTLPQAQPQPRLLTRLDQRRADSPRPIPAKAKLTAMVPRVVKAKATQRVIPAEAILVIRTTEQIGPYAWISRVTVWRLTYAPSRAQRTPVAKTT